MTQQIKAIPTLYAGVQFRSRLEARWAAFFDLCGLQWEYEPEDFHGYIPDFKLFDSLYVEVKPISGRFPSEVIDKAYKSGMKGPLLCLGRKPVALDAVAWDRPIHSSWIGTMEWRDEPGESDFSRVMGILRSDARTTFSGIFTAYGDVADEGSQLRLRSFICNFPLSLDPWKQKEVLEDPVVRAFSNIVPQLRHLPSLHISEVAGLLGPEDIHAYWTKAQNLTQYKGVQTI